MTDIFISPLQNSKEYKDIINQSFLVRELTKNDYKSLLFKKTVERFCSFHKITRGKICAAGLLCIHNFFGFFQKGWNKTKGYRHHHSKHMNRKSYDLQHLHKAFNTVGQ